MTTAHGITLFFGDVDGALVTREKVLTDEAKAAVRRMRDAGIAFAITSGRPPRHEAGTLVRPLRALVPESPPSYRPRPALLRFPCR